MSQDSGTPNYEDLSDEELMQIDPASAGISAPDLETEEADWLEDRIDNAAGPSADAGPAAADPEEGDEADEEGDEGVSEEDGDQPADAGDTPEDADADAKDGEESDKGEEDHTTPNHTGEGNKPEGADKDKAADKAETPDEPQDYEKLYKELMAPFKANGKEFTPSSADEVKRLMQMGANYTKKMQHLAPNLKLMRMLENKGLLQEDKLSFLIDLDQKNPEAIKKLLHDGKIDPMDLDTSSEPAYQPGNHSVSDQEMAFHETLGNVMQTTSGKETVTLINSGWDQDSKKAIYREPQLLSIIDEQRSNGLYAKISAEVDRRKILGEYQNVPFIVAYKDAGDKLHAEGKLLPPDASAQTQGLQNPAPQQPARPVLETRTAARKPSVTNGDKARAISSAPRAAKAAPAAPLDPFSMTDEEIMRVTSLKV